MHITTSVWKDALLTCLLVRISHSPCLCVCSFLSFAERRALLTVCLFSRHSIGPVSLSLSATVSWEPRGVPRRRARLAVLRGVATEVQRERLTSHHGSCLPGAMTQKSVEGNRKSGSAESVNVGLGVGPKCWHCGSNGDVEPKGRILGDSANLGYASKDDLTATLRHHESLQKIMNAGAPAAATDALATRIETVKQAVYAQGTCPRPACEGAGGFDASREVRGEEAQCGLVGTCCSSGSAQRNSRRGSTRTRTRT